MRDVNVFGLSYNEAGEGLGWAPLPLTSTGNVPFIPVGPGILTSSFQLLNVGNNSPGGSVEFARARAARVFKTLQVQTSDAIVWTPLAGNRFVLMGFTVSVCASIAVAGRLSIELADNLVPIWNGNAFCGDAIAGDSQLGADFGAYGYESSGVDNELILTLSEAPADGAVGITVWGIEI